MTAHLWHWLSLVNAPGPARYVREQLELAGFWRLHPYEIEAQVDRWLAMRKRGRLVYGYRDGKLGWH